MAKPKPFTDESVRTLQGPPGKVMSVPYHPCLSIRFGKQSKSYVTVTTSPATGKRVWTSIGLTDRIKIADAFKAADEIVKRIHEGLPAREVSPAAETLAQVADAYMAQIGSKQRRHADKRRRLDRWIPILGRDLPFQSITRPMVEAMLDQIAATSRRGADMALVDLQALTRFYMKRAPDDYVSKIHGGAIDKRDGTEPRDRVLDEKELRAIWVAAGQVDRFGVVLKLALYTAQRIGKILEMEWKDLDLDTGEWAIPRIKQTMKKWIPGEKGVPEVLPLPPAAVELIRSQLPMRRGRWVFPSVRGTGHMIELSVMKRELEARLPKMARWTVHDLRRSARTYMAELDVPSDVAERILGHKLPGVAGTYNRAKLEPQMKAALVTLANHIAKVTGENVVQMTQAG
jgi:integrase